MKTVNILFVTTQYRVGERIYPIISELSKYYNLDLMKLYQMNSTYQWPGDNDLRNVLSSAEKKLNTITKYQLVYLQMIY